MKAEGRGGMENGKAASSAEDARARGTSDKTSINSWNKNRKKTSISLNKDPECVTSTVA